MDNLLSLDSASLWALAVGFFSPPIISIIQQARWTPRTRSLVAFAFYLVVAAGTVFLSGALTGGDYIKVALVIFVLASVSYQHIWRPTGISPAIESVTSKSAPEPARVPEHRASSTPVSQPAADPAAPRPPATPLE